MDNSVLTLLKHQNMNFQYEFHNQDSNSTVSENKLFKWLILSSPFRIHQFITWKSQMIFTDMTPALTPVS